MRNLLVIAFSVALPILANDLSKQALSNSHTDRFNVPAAGTIRLDNSFGELDVDGWDRPEVEVTIMRSSEHLYDPKEHDSKQRDEAQRRLDSVQISAKQDGNDVVISTAYPPRNAFLHPLSRRSDIEVSYRIKAPRASKLIIDHNNGGVNVSDIRGDIHATVINGQITLTLAPGGHYGIDARCKIGDVYSDFDGHDQRRRLIGKEFVVPGSTPGAAPATNLYLRARIGDIVIEKLHGPAVKPD
jgi:hypothetical protein